MTTPIVPMGDGPPSARIMLVGEAWGEYEARACTPFVGPSGEELNRMLHEAKLMRSALRVTNVINARPRENKLKYWIAEKLKDVTLEHRKLGGRWCLPIVFAGVESLQREIDLVRPTLVLAAGNTALWALTGKTSVMKYRGSVMQLGGGAISPNYESIDGRDYPPKVIPIYHPAAILRQWEWRAITVWDLRRAVREAHSRKIDVPEWRFILRPSFDKVCETLHTLLAKLENEPLWIELDLETRAGHIACAGLSWSRLDAICVPFMTRDSHEGYFTLNQEAEVVRLLYRVLRHKHARVRGQNIIYDCQYTYRFWHFIPRVAQDTMISHHTAFCELPKKLDFQASMYCTYYTQWKPDRVVEKDGG